LSAVISGYTVAWPQSEDWLLGPLGFPMAYLVQADLGLFLAHTANRCNGGQLLLSRAGYLAFPVVDGLAADSNELAVVRSRKPQTFTLRPKSFGGKANAFGIGLGHL